MASVYKLPKYSCLVRPTSGALPKSPWNSFGFPANDAGAVLTRRFIVCVQCNCALLCNGQSNAMDDILNEHLRQEHADIYADNMRLMSNVDSGVTTPELLGRRTATPVTNSSAKVSQTARERPKSTATAINNSDNTTDENSSTNEDDHVTETEEAVIYIEENNGAVSVLDDPEEGIVEFLMPVKIEDEILDGDIDVIDDLSVVSIKTANALKRSKSPAPAAHDEIPVAKKSRIEQQHITETTNSPRSPLNLNRLFAEMCADDLLRPAIVEGAGFVQMVCTLTGYAPSAIPSVDEVRKELSRLSTDCMTGDEDVQSSLPYAFTVELWQNVERVEFFTLSLVQINRSESRILFTAQADQINKLKHNLLDIFKKRPKFEAILINFDETTRGNKLRLMLRQPKLPLIHCMAFVIEEAMGKALQTIPAECNVALSETDPNHATRTPNKRTTENVDTWRVKLKRMFEYSQRTYNKNAENSVIAEKVNAIATYLEPLNIAFETLRDAPASLNLPLAQQLMANHFGDDAENEMIQKLRSSVRETFDK